IGIELHHIHTGDGRIQRIAARGEDVVRFLDRAAGWIVAIEAVRGADDDWPPSGAVSRRLHDGRHRCRLRNVWQGQAGRSRGAGAEELTTGNGHEILRRIEEKTMLRFLILEILDRFGQESTRPSRARGTWHSFRAQYPRPTRYLPNVGRFR